MSSISYREWEIWKNSDHFETYQTFDGYYECQIIPTTMAIQTVEFLIEKYEIRNFNFNIINPFPREYNHSFMYNNEGELHLKLYSSFINTDNIKDKIEEIENFLNNLSICVDFPFICQKIRFIDNYKGKIFISNRKSIGRGFAFEIDERITATSKINSDFNALLSTNDLNLKVGLKHYLTGMQLLSLEDQTTGLLDAAFMQFYQGCEALSNNTNGSMNTTKQFIATKIATNSKDLQIITHQVWKVRHKYFGHGDANFNKLANTNITTIRQVINQVLVVRYLCRTLLDSYTISGTTLLREMSFYTQNNGSAFFNGNIGQLSLGSEFYVDFHLNPNDREVKILDTNGTSIDTYTL